MVLTLQLVKYHTIQTEEFGNYVVWYVYTF